MLNYIRAEFYKLLRRKYTYIALGIFLLLESLLVAGNVFHNAHSFPIYFGESVIFIVEMGKLGFCAVLLTGDIVFAGQHKNSTLKNEVSFGLSRSRIYLGKLIAQTLLAILYMVVMIGFYVGLSAILLPHDLNTIITIPNIVVPEGFTGDVGGLKIVGYFLGAAFPLWIGAQAATCMCLFLIPNDLGASLTALYLTMVLDVFVQLAGLLIRGDMGTLLLKVYEYLPWPALEGAMNAIGSWNCLGKAWIVGLFWVAACTAIGLYGFNRREIK